MSDDHQAFADWLKQRAGQAGYDLAKRGVISELARDSGNDPAQMSRFLRGQAIPAIEGQRGLAKALGIKLPPVMIAAGTATPEDFEDYREPPRREISLDAVADELDATETERSIVRSMLVSMIEGLRNAGIPGRSHVQRGVGGHPRAHTLKPDQAGE